MTKKQIKPNLNPGLDVKSILLGVAFTFNLLNSSFLTATESSSGEMYPFFLSDHTATGGGGRSCHLPQSVSLTRGYRRMCGG